MKVKTNILVEATSGSRPEPETGNLVLIKGIPAANIPPPPTYWWVQGRLVIIHTGLAQARGTTTLKETASGDFFFSVSIA
jgi:hypothetical protein